MRAVFATWRGALRARPSVLWQMAVPYLVMLIAAFLAGFSTVFSGAAAALVWVVGGAAVLALFVFTLGAAFAAIGEAIRGDAPTRYLERAKRFFWRTLGVIGFAILVALPSVIVGAAGFSMIFVAALSGVAGQLLTIGMAVMGFSVVLALLTTPFVYSLEAGVFVGSRTAPQAFRVAFADAYRGGRFWRWLLTALIIGVFGGVDALLRGAPGVLGIVLGFVVSVLVLWLGTSLAFANWHVNQG